jgi:enterochelin esterase-like enzyme
MKFLALISCSLLLWSCVQAPEVAIVKDESLVSFDTIQGVNTGTLLRTNIESEFISDRPLDIWLPRTYDGKRKHAVLCMYDAQMLFDGSSTWNGQEWRVDEVVDSLLGKKTIIPTVVVALHNGGQKRNFEYFPQKPAEKLHATFSDSVMSEIAQRYGSDTVFSVSSDAYLKYVTHEVLPMVWDNFKVYKEPSVTAIMGSSMGGLMSMYAIGEYPDIFGTALCMSTHWPGGFAPNEEIPTVFNAYVKQNIIPERVGKIYFDYGTETLDAMYEPFQNQVNEVLEENGFVQGENWTTENFPGAAHDEKSWAKRLHIPLIFAFGK